MASADQVFNQAKQRFRGIVVDAATKEAEQFRKEVEKFLDDFMLKFYSQMFVYADNKQYKPLSESHETAKLTLGIFGIPSFYRHTGKLQATLLSRSPRRDLGKPKVTFSKKGRGRRRRGTISLDTRGVPHTTTGSFASYSDAFKDLVFDLEIEMYPRIQGSDYDSVFRRYRKDIRVKFQSNQKIRPLFSDFSEYYGTTVLRESIKRKFGVKV